MSTVVAVANQKGGVGKTTTAVTLAHGLARQGERVLLMDLDPQGNVADCLGMDAGHELARLLNPIAPEFLRNCMVESGRPNLWIVRSDKSTAALKQSLAGMDFREFSLHRAIGEKDADSMLFDVVVLDCAPSVDVLQTAALVAADWLVVPTRLDQLAVKGVRDLLVSLADVHRMRRTVCQLAGVVPTFYDRVTGESQRQLMHLAQQFGRLVMPPVPVDTVCREATRAGKSLWEFAPQCRAISGDRQDVGRTAIGYQAVLTRLGKVIHGR